MKIRVVYLIIDTQRLTLYHEDGETTVIPQGDPRVSTIIEQVMPRVSAGLVAEVDLATDCPYEQFEEKTGGLVRFFRVAKQKLKELFSDPVEPITPGEFGTKPESKPLTNEQRVAEVIAHATPVKGKVSSQMSSEDTIVASVGGQMVTQVEKVRDHIQHAVKLGSTKGMEAFFRRCAAVAENRGHTVNELLRFMEKGDLPVADDGSIIAYKLLWAKGDGWFVDPHTRKVRQRVGSYVMMDEKLVDPSRRTECSQGLHIARRDYLRGFDGDSCFLVKLAPEDVIAVPRNEPSKIRACGYHIVAQLPEHLKNRVKSGQPMSTEPEARELLAKVITGNHVGRIEEVRITGGMGEGVKIRSLATTKLINEQPVLETEIAQAVAIDDPEVADKPTEHINPKSLVQVEETPVNQEKEEPVLSPYKNPSRKDKGLQLVAVLMDLQTPLINRKAAAHQLREFKKTTKVGWDKIGVDEKALTMINMVLKDEPAPVKASKKTKALSAMMKPNVEATLVVKQQSQLEEEVMRLHRLGTMSKRAIGRELQVSDRTVGRIIDRNGG